MNDGFNKYFKQQEKLQNRMNQINTPPINSLISQSHTWHQRHDEMMIPDWFQNIQRQADLMNRNSGLANNLFTTQDSLKNALASPIQEAFDNQRQLFEQANIFSNYNFDNFHKLHSSINHLINSPSFNFNDLIPDSFYTPLDDIAIEFENSFLFRESDDDVLSEITVSNTVVTQGSTITWLQFFMHILTIFMAIYTIYASNVSSDQFEEHMIEMKKQTNIQEQILIEIQSRPETEQSEFNQSIDEKLDLLLDSIELFMVDSIDPDEDSLE